MGCQPSKQRLAQNKVARKRGGAQFQKLDTTTKIGFE
jgi:hypothetical protein